MHDTLLIIALWLIIILLLVQIVRSERRRPKFKPVWPEPPCFYDVDKLSDLPPQAYLMGTLVNVKVGIGSRGVHIYNGKEFVKLEQRVCPTCGK